MGTGVRYVPLLLRLLESYVKKKELLTLSLFMYACLTNWWWVFFCTCFGRHGLSVVSEGSEWSRVLEYQNGRVRNSFRSVLFTVTRLEVFLEPMYTKERHRLKYDTSLCLTHTCLTSEE